MSYIRGEDRYQGALFPVTLEDLIPEDHLVRVIEAYVSNLDLAALGFTRAQATVMGRPAYDPSDLLKLYLYGYLNQVRSSRRLERECQRNVEVMWLLGRLAPDFKTIADFRRDNGPAFVAVCAHFVQFCRAEQLLGGTCVAVDGSKFQAVASKRKATTRAQLKRQQAKVAEKIAEYLEILETADREEAPMDATRRGRVTEALTRLRQGKAKLDRLEAFLEEQGVKQHVEGEPEAKLMKTGQGRAVVSYNVQTAVDAQHGLIVHHDVTDEPADNCQLYPMARSAKDVLAADQLTVLADAGYSNGEQFGQCEAEGIAAHVPVQRAINNRGGGTLFNKTAFSYDAASDSFRCPAGRTLQRKQISRANRMIFYTTDACGDCQIKAQCTQGKQRTVTRHFDEAAFERMAARLEGHPEAMAQRRAIVEHPFGTLKCHIFGNGRLLLRGMKGAKTEMALGILAYNFRLAVNLMTPRRLAAALG